MTMAMNLPELPCCPECGAQGKWELEGHVVREVSMHTCQCSRSEFQRTLRACAASPGGHDPETISAGQHSFDRCRKCGHHV